jgi:hypothetical protein
MTSSAEPMLYISRPPARNAAAVGAVAKTLSALQLSAGSSRPGQYYFDDGPLKVALLYLLLQNKSERRRRWPGPSLSNTHARRRRTHSSA